MSWKPCRGGRMILDKAIEKSHTLYFKFQEAATIQEKSKIAFQWMRAEQYLGNEKRFFAFIGEKFIQDCKADKKTYKPFLKHISQLN